MWFKAIGLHSVGWGERKSRPEAQRVKTQDHDSLLGDGDPTCGALRAASGPSLARFSLPLLLVQPYGYRTPSARYSFASSVPTRFVT